MTPKPCYIPGLSETERRLQPHALDIGLDLSMEIAFLLYL